MPLGDVLHGLTILALVVLASLAAGRLFASIRQPRVLGPISLGIAVGTAIAACSEDVRAVLIPHTSKYLLEAAGTAGLLLLMFLVGAELRGVGAADRPTFSWRILPCVVLPILMCALVAWPFGEHLGVTGDHAGYGWLFVGIALGVTAVPVLVTIIADLGIGSSPVAGAALRIAVVTDGLAWILVTALVIATHLGDVSVAALAAGAVLLVVVTVVIPRVVAQVQGGPLVVVMVVSALAGAAATQFLGFHPAIGAVLAGFFFPAGRLDAGAQRTFGSVVDVLLPAFFVSAAMSVPLQALRDQVSWAGMVCLAALAVVAFVSKLTAGGVFGALHRWDWRSSMRLGVLLNCRGVTEIAIASVGFQAGLVSPFGFAMLCGLAIVTTAATTPLYRALADTTDHSLPRV
ncbi:cation:proton antiporter [Mycobacterium sp. MS1601]|uniref:cation:proton antiporter n=1 Tax=Mycobacterium sp. MS1601 TaxID=1936029 RepID=UPI00097930B4|nr:cation:proton antiporter [Mycobacterium sp. MS1601]AQA01979.1 cation:proton antiporter [Mycobacterium sp. MS1601]